MKLLLADDEKAICAIFAHHIKKYSSPYIKWKTVNDGVELLEVSRSWKPDIIITDIKMPNMTGLEAIDEIKHTCEPDSLRIYILSGYTEFKLVRTALKLGVVDYIPKPIKYSQLENLLNTEETQRYIGISLEDAYNLNDETTALLLSDTIQALTEAYLRKNQQNFEQTLSKWKQLSAAHSINIDPSYFTTRFKSDKVEASEQIETLESYINENHFPQESFDPIDQIKRMVETSFSDSSFGLDQVSLKLGYNTQYLSTLFKQEMHENFSSYLTGFRINHAKDMLINTDYKIKDIAAACGYNYPNYFIKVFNKLEKTSPDKWRKQTR